MQQAQSSSKLAYSTNSTINSRFSLQQQHQRELSVNQTTTPQLYLTGQKPKSQNPQSKLTLANHQIYKTSSQVAVSNTAGLDVHEIAEEPHTAHALDQEFQYSHKVKDDIKEKNFLQVRKEMNGGVRGNSMKGKISRMRDQLQILRINQMHQQLTAGSCLNSKVGQNSFKSQLTQSPYYIPQIHDSQLDMIYKQQARMKNYLGHLQSEIQERYSSNAHTIAAGKTGYKQLSTQTPLPYQTHIGMQRPVQRAVYKYQIMPGNNSQLVKRVMSTSGRSAYWSEIPNQTSSHFQFRWAPVSRQVNFDRLGYNFFLQITNHFEGHSEISRKHELFKNLRAYCDESNENAFYITPLTFYLKVSNEKPSYSIKQQLQLFKSIFNLLEEFKGMFDPEKDSDKKDVPEKAVYDLKSGQHPKLQTLIDSGNVSFISKHKFPKGASLQQRKAFTFEEGATQKTDMYKSSMIYPGEYSMPLCHFIGKNVWILKPTSLNRGQGIHVASSFKKIKRLVRDYCRGKEMVKEVEKLAPTSTGQLHDKNDLLSQLLSMSDQQQKQPVQVLKHNTFIIQKYIERPLLINKRKFDIRVWVLVNQDMEVFFFKEGYLRTSSTEYTTDKSSLNNEYMHLTNNAVQKNAPNYGNFEDGNQLSFPYFRQYLKEHHGDQDIGDFDKSILPKMKYFAALAMISAKRKLNPNKRKQCFEIFGYDYIIDSDFNVWLIEVNTNPCIEESSSILKQLIPRMLDDAFKLTLDLIFPPPNIESNSSQLDHFGHSSGLGNLEINSRTVSKASKIRMSYDEADSPPKDQHEIFRVDGYPDKDNMWEKIAVLKGSNEASQILVPKPAGQRLINSERLISFIDQFEMRLVRPDIIENERKQLRNFSK